MRFELEPDNRDCPDEVLLADLRHVAKRLGLSSLTKKKYDANGRFCSATMRNRFGAWTRALEAAGLTVENVRVISDSELIADLKKVSEKVGTGTVTRTDYRTLGEFSEPPFVRRFGSWAKALELAGLKVSSAFHQKATDDELFDNMATVWEHVGRQPKQRDFHPPVSKFGEGPYLRRFGAWRKALEAFVTAANGPDGISPPTASPWINDVQTARPEQARARTPRQPSWRLRFLVMRRDRFSCIGCGASPSKVPDVDLDVDHVLAWSKGGETVFGNLQTLCKRCNIGKSDLSMGGG